MAQLEVQSARTIEKVSNLNSVCHNLPELLAKVMDFLDLVAVSFVPFLKPDTIFSHTVKMVPQNHACDCLYEEYSG